MPENIKDLNVLKEYICGVLGRAEHHAGNVDEVIFTLVGLVIWRAEEDSIKVRTQEGGMKNVIWVNIGDNKYAFSYNHDSLQVEMRERTTGGAVIKEFDNNSSLAEMKTFFKNL